MAVTRADGVHFDAKMAGADLSSSVGLVCKIDTDGDVVLTSGNTDYPAGVITEGAAEGYPVTFQTDGLCKAIASAAITAGSRVMAGANGKVATMSGGTSMSFGVARSTVADDGEIVEIQIDRSRGA